MGKDLKGRELGTGISQREDGLYVGRFTNKYGKRVQKVLPKLKDVRQWLGDEQYKDEHSNSACRRSSGDFETAKEKEPFLQTDTVRVDRVCVFVQAGDAGQKQHL